MILKIEFLVVQPLTFVMFVTPHEVKNTPQSLLVHIGHYLKYDSCSCFIYIFKNKFYFIVVV